MHGGGQGKILSPARSEQVCGEYLLDIRADPVLDYKYKYF